MTKDSDFSSDAHATQTKTKKIMMEIMVIDSTIKKLTAQLKEIPEVDAEWVDFSRTLFLHGLLALTKAFPDPKPPKG